MSRRKRKLKFGPNEPFDEEAFLGMSVDEYLKLPPQEFETLRAELIEAQEKSMGDFFHDWYKDMGGKMDREQYEGYRKYSRELRHKLKRASRDSLK